MPIPEEEDESERPRPPHEFRQTTSSSGNSEVEKGPGMQQSAPPTGSTGTGTTLSRDQLSSAFSDVEQREGRSSPTPSNSSEAPSNSAEAPSNSCEAPSNSSEAPHNFFEEPTLEEIISMKRKNWRQKLKMARNLDEHDQIILAALIKARKGSCIFCRSKTVFEKKFNLKLHFLKCPLIKKRKMSLEGPRVETAPKRPAEQGVQNSQRGSTFGTPGSGLADHEDLQAEPGLPPTPRAPVTGGSGTVGTGTLAKS